MPLLLLFLQFTTHFNNSQILLVLLPHSSPRETTPSTTSNSGHQRPDSAHFRQLFRSPQSGGSQSRNYHYHCGHTLSTAWSRNTAALHGHLQSPPAKPPRCSITHDDVPSPPVSSTFSNVKSFTAASSSSSSSSGKDGGVLHNEQWHFHLQHFKHHRWTSSSSKCYSCYCQSADCITQR